MAVRMGEYTIFRLGDYVRISLEYSEPALWGQTGRIVGLPIQEDSCEYLVILEGGIFGSPALANRKVLIHCSYFDFA
jgi:hypothetical protein